MVTLTAEQKLHFIDQGYLVVKGVLTADRVAKTKAALIEVLNIDESAPIPDVGKLVLSPEPEVIATTIPARTPEFESIVEQLCGPDFLRGIAYSPYLKWHHKPTLMGGYIPIVNFPKKGEAKPFDTLGYHIDGGEEVTLWPDKNFLAVMAYLSDVESHGGATVIRPGSHRQVFEEWRKINFKPNGKMPGIPDLNYNEPVAIEAKAGDVCFMHYLCLHSGSDNVSHSIRYGLNTAVMPDPHLPYQPKIGVPNSSWTPLDYTLRTDNLG